MEERPKIMLQLSSIDILLEILGWCIIIAVWVLIIINYSSLPNTIPTHYNGTGQVDGFGGKSNILALPIISTILYIGLTILNRYPHIFNYPIKITQENAFRQYTTVTRLIRTLKLSIVLIFGFLVFKTIQNTKGETDGLGIWILPFTLALIFIPIIYFTIKSFKEK
jgi:uncharacterized membrane protein